MGNQFNYNNKIKCKNCKNCKWILIPKGIPIKEFCEQNSLKCDVCECLIFSGEKTQDGN